MLLYKINEELEEKRKDVNLFDLLYPKEEKKENVDHFMNLVMHNYLTYYDAPSNIQSRYDFSLQAVYSCLSKVNNEENKSDAKMELSKFLYAVNEKAEMNLEVVKMGNKLYVREKGRVKSKKYKRLTT